MAAMGDGFLARTRQAGRLAAIWRACGIAATLAASVGASLALSACASNVPAVRGDPYAFAPWSEDDYQYRLDSGDVLRLSFQVDTDMDADVTVGPDGQGVFPLIGAVSVAGLTVDQASQRLTGAYAPILRNPQVQTLLTTYGSTQIYVGGEVRTPGVVAIKGPMNVAQALMAAGGFQDTARTGQVIVLRRTPNGQLASRSVDVRRLLSADPREDFLTHPGDLIFVPRSSISEVNLFVRQYIQGILPLNFGYDLGRKFN